MKFYLYKHNQVIPIMNPSLIRNIFLGDHIRSIKNELGEDNYNVDDEFSELKEKIINCKMPEEVEKEAMTSNSLAWKKCIPIPPNQEF